jgi:hypothetical protein
MERAKWRILHVISGLGESLQSCGYGLRAGYQRNRTCAAPYCSGCGIERILLAVDLLPRQ